MSSLPVTLKLENFYIIAHLRKSRFVGLTLIPKTARTSFHDTFTECKWRRSMKPCCSTWTGTWILFQKQSAACATTHSYAKRHTQRSPLTELFHQRVGEGWLYGVMGEGCAPVKGSTEKASCRALASCPASAQWPVSPDTTTQFIIQHHLHLCPALEMQ